jgi:hypothetical protein
MAMGLLSDGAKVFLESLAPVEDAMRALDFAEIEQKLEREQQQRLAALDANGRRRFGYMRDDE